MERGELGLCTAALDHYVSGFAVQGILRNLIGVTPYHLRLFNIILILIAGYCNTSAQPPAIFFDHLTTRDGLSNNSVNSLLKDRQGFLWAGTSDGLNRFDGKNFISFYHSIHDAGSIPHNDVYSLMQDADGYIWIGTFNGLCRQDPATKEITRIALPANSDTTSFFTISDVKQIDGEIWVATSKGLYRVKNMGLVPAMNTQFITKIVVDGAGKFWLGTYLGLLQYDPRSGRSVSYKVPGRDSTLIKCLYLDKQNKLWMGTWGRGLQCFDIATKTFTRFLPQENLGERPDANIIYNITGQDSILWIAADALGLLAFNTNTKKFTPYSSATDNGLYGIYGHGFSFYASAGEGLWIGGSNGLYRYDPHHQLFRHVTLKVNFDKYCLKEILNAYTDPLDRTGKTLLLGTWSCGSYRLNLQTGATELLSPNLVQSFYRDEDSVLWMAAGGLLSVAGSSRKYPLPGIQLITGAGDGNLWLGSRNGLFLFNKKTGTMNPVFKTGFNAPHDASDQIMAMVFDQDNNLWFCTNLVHNKRSAVGKIAPGSSRPVLYFPDSSPIQGMAMDNNNNVWCASWNGLVYWNAREANPVFRRLTRKEGLCNDKVFKLHADKQGRIWAATLRGISCYDPAVKAFRNYYAAQGLHQDNIANLFQNQLTGELIAGHEASLDIFDPAHAFLRKDTPSIVITGLKVFNKEFPVNKGLVLLKPGQNMTAISFSALSFTDTREVRYAYKMEGVDKDWTITENDVVTYHNLPPGARRFYVRARNAEGTWSKESAWLEIDLAPPFYRTWWFMALATAAIALLIYLFYRGRIRRLEEKFRIRSTIARDLHDEIGSTLTSINILSRVTHYNLEKDKTKAAGLLQKITEQSQDMQQSMSDIIWAIRPDNDKLENMAARMREFMSQTLEAKNIAIHFEADEQVLKESLGMEQRKDFFLIFKEAVNNAAKYAATHAVTVTMKKESHHIMLCIADEGIGFDVTKKYSSNGLRNMQARAAALGATLTITSAPGKGTQVRLSIPAT